VEKPAAHNSRLDTTMPAMEKEKITCKKLRNFQSYMNVKALGNAAYIPTEVEHIANVLSHGFCVIPALAGLLHMLRLPGLAASSVHYWAAFVYGSALVTLFTVSTTFHALSYHRGYMHHYSKCSPLSSHIIGWLPNHITDRLQEAFHIGDRAVIYFFIAASYTPWLTLREVGTAGELMRWMVWALAAIGTTYQYIFHERFKWLETLLYLIVALSPAIILTLFMNPPDGLKELACGGLIYITGVIFFKSDGRIPCAHAIWHLFVFMGASIHYYAVCQHLLLPMANSTT